MNIYNCIIHFKNKTKLEVQSQEPQYLEMKESIKSKGAVAWSIKGNIYRTAEMKSIELVSIEKQCLNCKKPLVVTEPTLDKNICDACWDLN